MLLQQLGPSRTRLTRVLLACLLLLLFQLQQGHDDRRYHETLDDLLSAVSPAYVRRRQKLLFAKLEEVAKSRSWNDEQDEQEEQEQAR